MKSMDPKTLAALSKQVGMEMSEEQAAKVTASARARHCCCCRPMMMIIISDHANPCPPSLRPSADDRHAQEHEAEHVEQMMKVAGCAQKAKQKVVEAEDFLFSKTMFWVSLVMLLLAVLRYMGWM